MKVTTIDTKKIIVSRREAYEISENATNFFLINGKYYYLSKCEYLFKYDMYELTFIGKDAVEIALEIVKK